MWLIPCCSPALRAGNTVRTNLISTGAFEVSYEGVPVWSKVSHIALPTCCGCLQTPSASGKPALRGCPSAKGTHCAVQHGARCWRLAAGGLA